MHCRCWFLLGLLGTIACGGDDPPPPSNTRVYVGTYGSDIHVLSMDPESLQLTPMATTPTGDAPSFLAIDPQGRWLVASAESGNTAHSFAIGGDGTLASIDEQPVGMQPAHVGLDATGAWVLVANFGGGTVSVLPIDGDGMLGPATEVAADDTPHQIVVHPNNELAFAPCLEANGIVVYSFAATGTLEPIGGAGAPAGAGPRHLAISRSGAFAWLLNEFSSSVTTYRIARDGTLSQEGTVSALPAGFTGDNASAEIALHPTLNVLYASNRGHDSIAVFDAGGDGTLALRETVATGKDPRHFSFVPGGGAMLVANQGSGSITALSIDDTGGLSIVGEVGRVDAPAFVGVLELP